MFTIFSIGEGRLRVLMYMIVFVTALFGAVRSEGRDQKISLFERTVMGIVGPTQNVISHASRGVVGFFGRYFDLVGVKEESELLRKENLVLKNKIFELEELKRENKRIKGLFKFGESLGYQKTLARVIGRDRGRVARLIRIDQGEKNQMREGLPVVTEEGLVGYVHRVSGNYSDVLTILDQNNRVDGIVARTRSHGIVEGHLNGKCIMKYVTRSEPVIINDQVITSGLGSIYPKGLRIGKILDIERESYGVTQFVKVEPSVNFGKLEEVIVLKPERGQGQDSHWPNRP